MVDAAEDAEGFGLEVDVADAECEDFAHAEAGERGHEEDRGVLLCESGPHERVDFLRRVEVEVLGAVDDRESLDVAGGVRGEPVRAAGALEDRVENRDELLCGAAGELPARHPVCPPCLDRGGRDCLDAAVAEGGEEVNVEGGPVVAFRGGLPGFAALAAFVRAVPVPRFGGVGEGCSGARGDPGAAVGVAEDAAQLGFGGALGVVPGGRAALPGSGVAETLLHLDAVGAVLHVPLRAALPVDAEGVAGGGEVRLIEHRS